MGTIDAGQVTEVARGISEYGVMAVICAVFLALSAALMIACFRWFKSTVDIVDGRAKADEGTAAKLDAIAEEARRQGEALEAVAEGLKTETALRLRNLTGFAFDLAAEQVFRLVRRTQEVNHIDDRESTREKITSALQALHDSRDARFDAFTYRGRRLSEYSDPAWVGRVAAVVEREVYDPDRSDDRTAGNIRLVYDAIRNEFYRRMNGEAGA